MEWHNQAYTAIFWHQTQSPFFHANTLLQKIEIKKNKVWTLKKKVYIVLCSVLCSIYCVCVSVFKMQPHAAGEYCSFFVWGSLSTQVCQTSPHSIGSGIPPVQEADVEGFDPFFLFLFFFFFFFSKLKVKRVWKGKKNKAKKSTSMKEVYFLLKAILDQPKSDQLIFLLLINLKLTLNCKQMNNRNIRTLQLTPTQKGQVSWITFSLVKIRSGTNANEDSIDARSKLLPQKFCSFCSCFNPHSALWFFFFLTILQGWLVKENC